MLAVVRLDSHSPKTYRAPMLIDIALPTDQTYTQRTVSGRTPAVTGSSRQIVMIGIFANRTGCRKCRGEPRHAFANASQPLGWHPLFIPMIELRYDLMLQQAIQCFCLSRIPSRIFSMLLTITDGPADFW